MKNKDTLIICPVKSTDIKFHNNYDKDNHWISSQNKFYDLMALRYNDEDINESNFDFIIKSKGQKWIMVREAMKNFDFMKYKYIGIFDDDIITDIWNIEKALNIAKYYGLSAFQLSLLPESTFDHIQTVQNKNYDFTETSFIEIMMPFFRIDKFQKLLYFLKEYPELNLGYGIDFAFRDIIEGNTYVIHSATAYHPQRKSSIDNRINLGMEEMDRFFKIYYPKIIKKLYNRNPLTFGRNEYSAYKINNYNDIIDFVNKKDE